jgi:hypothetical protein
MSCSCQNKSNPVVSINNEKLLQGNLYEATLLAFSLNPAEFESRLNKLGLKFDGNPYEDIEFLAKLSNMGLDKSGKLQDVNGKPIVFDLRSFIKDIPVDMSNANPIKIELV